MDSHGGAVIYVCSEIVVEKDDIWVFSRKPGGGTATYFGYNSIIKGSPVNGCLENSLVLKGTWVLEDGAHVIIDNVTVYKHKGARITGGAGSKVVLMGNSVLYEVP
jgi:hypothetical protein